MLKALYLARESLNKKRIWNTDMVMVLFAMLEEGVSYTEALRAYAEYLGKTPVEVEGMLLKASMDAGLWSGPRYILERCYQEVSYENGIFASEGS